MTKKSLFRPLAEREGEALFPSFHIEVDGRGKSASVLISGVVGVKSFSESEISVRTKYDAISVTGAFLRIALLESKSIRVSGEINGIAFSNRKRGGGQ